MKPDMAEYFRCEKTCRAIWDKVNPNFLKKADNARIFYLLLDIAQTSEGSRTVQEYANDLKTL